MSPIFMLSKEIVTKFFLNIVCVIFFDFLSLVLEYYLYLIDVKIVDEKRRTFIFPLFIFFYFFTV